VEKRLYEKYDAGDLAQRIGGSYPLPAQTLDVLVQHALPAQSMHRLGTLWGTD
jgi:hypothetical protein